MSEQVEQRHVEVFFDGECPLCVREIRLLRLLDRRHRIRFTDISVKDFRPELYQKSFSDFMDEIHGRLPDGSWITGVEVFRRLYSAVGFGPLVVMTRLPGVSHASIAIGSLRKIACTHRSMQCGLWSGSCAR